MWTWWRSVAGSYQGRVGPGRELLLAGDIAPGGMRSHVVNCPGDALIMANLEGPILPMDGAARPARKAGPHISASRLPEVPNQLVVSLANNHLMDFGEAGLAATKAALKSRQWLSVGAGPTLGEARRPLTVECESRGIAVVAACEEQFGAAQPRRAGVAGVGPWIYKEIGAMKDQGHFVVVSVHGGVEQSPWPAPFTQDTYRSYVDAGADIVHGHHPHQPQGVERYRSATICYGLGNFAVDAERWGSHANGLWSLGLHVPADDAAWSLLEFRVTARNTGVGLTTTSSLTAEHDEYMALANRPLADRDLLERLWDEVAVRAFYAYGAEYSGLRGALSWRSRIHMAVRGLTPGKIKSRLLRRSPGTLLPYVMVGCDSHREMLKRALGILSGELTDGRNLETRELADQMIPQTRSTRAPL